MKPPVTSMRAWVLAALLIPGICGSQEAQKQPEPVLVIHAGAVLTTPGEPPLGPQTIVIRDGKIASMQAGFSPASAFGANARLIDLSHQFVLPGLIDLHMHLAIMMNADPQTVGSEPRLALAAAGYAKKLLEAGVTTVRDVGDNTGVTFALRDAFASGELPGPRLFAAGRIISRTGGHGAERAAPGDIPYSPAACDGPESCRRAVRQNIEQGSDWIKVTVSGSGRESGGRPDAAPTIFPDEMTAVAEAARQADRPVAAHAHSTSAINLALSAGVRTIEHGTYFDDKSIALFKRNGAFLVPTAFVASFVRSKLDMFAGGRDGRSSAELKAWTDAALAGPGRAWRAGIRLGLGTDGGPSFDPDATAREVGLYVASGVPAAEAIRAATSNGAEILGLGSELGHIKPGFTADLIAVNGNPIDDVARLREVVFVMKDGVVYKSIDAAASQSK
ncbi:MAG: amidohydrolase family protein [Luteimonas sp.]